MTNTTSTTAETKAVNLFTSLYGWLQEEPTSKTLAYLLEEFPACKAAFLSRLGCSANPKDTKIDQEYWIHKEEGTNSRVDLVFQNNSEYVIFVENKPKGGASFTSSKEQEGDQLKRYANALNEDKKFKDFKKKILCLLATDDNKDNLLKNAAIVEGEGIGGDENSLKEHYARKGIDFIVISWEQVFEELATVEPENAVFGFLVKDLKQYVATGSTSLPLEALIKRDNISEKEIWMGITKLVTEAKGYAESSLEMFKFDSLRGNPSKDDPNFYGCYITDRKHHVTYWFGFYKWAWEQFCAQGKNNFLFIVQVQFRKGDTFNNIIDGKRVVDHQTLIDCEFEFDSRTGGLGYVYPLVDSSELVDPSGKWVKSDKIADTLVKILSKVHDTLASAHNDE
jgi:hypothetical protein